MIIGRNGARKLVLRKVVACITQPTGDYAEINWKQGPFLEVGNACSRGAHPDDTVCNQDRAGYVTGT